MPGYKKVIPVLLLLLVVSMKISGQQLIFETIREEGDFFSRKITKITPETKFSIVAKASFTSISIQIKEGESFYGTYFLVENDTFHLSKDEDAEVVNGLVNANLISFNHPVSQAYFYANQLNSDVIFNFINGSTEEEMPEFYTKSEIEDCLQEPSSIEQQLWRAGLTPPSYNRSFSTVQHVIIHHSAGSNSNTNYTQVVRDIYIYHTEVNGWSDIGYNYLVAQDGTIFKGRDPADTGAQDDVRGAHFCGMNSGTMGICLLGNYTAIPPTAEAIQSLLNLISWKLDKESLNAFESFSFNSINNLGVIAGHRDGCATECPGSRTYEEIFKYKQQVNSIIELCYPDELIADFPCSNEDIFTGESVNFNDASLGNPTSWEWKMEGAVIENYGAPNPNNVIYPNVGEFDVTLVVRNGARTDTASISKLIKVKSDPFADPAAFPSPVYSYMPLKINLNKEKIDEVKMISLYGKELLRFIPLVNQLEVDITPYTAGLYFVRFYSGGQVVKSEKIVIAN